MACSVYASPIAAHQSSVVLRPPRRAGVRPASPYARASSLPRTRLRPLSLSLSLNIPLCAMASVSAPELCSSSADINPRVRRHEYSASAPSSINSPSRELSDCPTSTSTSTYSTLVSDDYSTSSPDCASAASSSKFPACVSSYAAYPVPASAATPPANHSPYPIFTSNLDSSSLASSFAPSSPSSPVSASSSVYYSCPASAVTSPVSANFTTSPFTPFSPIPPWSTSASSNSRWPTSPYVPPPLSSLSTHFQSPPLTRSPSPSPILFSSPPFPHPSPLDARTPPSFSHITPHIAIADLAFAESADLLEREGVTHVVSVLRERSHIPSCIPPSNRLHVPLDDAPFAELVGHLSPIVQWVKDVLEGAGVIGAGNDPHAEQPKSQPQPPTRILIHCAHGISRSPAVGAALLVALPLIDAGEADLSELRREDEDGRLSQNHTKVEDDAMEVSSPTTSWTSPARRCTSPASFSFLASPPSPVRDSTPRPSPTPSPTPTIRLRSPSRLSRPTLPLFIPPSAPAASAPSPLRPTPPPPPLLAVPPPTASSPTSTVAAPLPLAMLSSSSLPLPPPPAPASASPPTVKRTLSAPAALAYVSARRPAADVNWGFRAQLSEWEGVCRRKSEGAATL